LAYGNNNVRDEEIPPFFKYGYLSGFSAIRDCDLAIHHGGHSSCMGSIYHGKSTLIIPTNSERDWNAQRVEHLGFGKRLPLEELHETIYDTILKNINFQPKKLSPSQLFPKGKYLDNLNILITKI
jgi:UDP:flavonoid glycosyltransferase YjiC (YdhE family)